MCSPHITASDHYNLGDRHETFKDTAKNMYRTSYADMVGGNEIAVKSDMPAGYGGHVPSLCHDVLFRNTAFDTHHLAKRTMPSRDSFPHFGDQKAGFATYTQNPRGPKTMQTAGTIPSTNTSPPWAVTLALQEPPTYRTGVPRVPPGTPRKRPAVPKSTSTLTPLIPDKDHISAGMVGYEGVPEAVQYGENIADCLQDGIARDIGHGLRHIPVKDDVGSLMMI